MLPMLASLSAAESVPAEALEDALELEDDPELEELDEPEEPEEPELEELDEPEEPELPLEEEPEADAVDEDDDAVESPALSVVVCDAVSQAATKKATAKSAIRRCNMIMLPVFTPAHRNGLPTFQNFWRYSQIDPPAFDCPMLNTDQSYPQKRDTETQAYRPKLLSERNSRPPLPKKPINGNKKLLILGARGNSLVILATIRWVASA